MIIIFIFIVIIIVIVIVIIIVNVIVTLGCLHFGEGHFGHVAVVLLHLRLVDDRGVGSRVLRSEAAVRGQDRTGQGVRCRGYGIE